MEKITVDFLALARAEVGRLRPRGLPAMDRDDVVQAAAIAAWRTWEGAKGALNSQRPAHQQRAYLGRAARCAALTYLAHRASRLREVPMEEVVIAKLGPATAPSPDEVLAAAHTEARIVQVLDVALSRMTPRERELALDKLGIAAMSESLATGVCGGTRNSLAFRARAKLAQASKELECQDLFDEFASAHSFA